MTLVDDLRQLVAAEPNEYVVAGKDYWTDAQLQAALDERRTLIDFEPVDYLPRVYGGGSVEYKRAQLRVPGAFEAGSTGGTIQNGLGGTATGWTITKIGEINFTANTLGTAYYFTGYTYDLYAAAADVLEQWASQVKLHFDAKTDDQTFQRSQKITHLRQQATEYRRRAQVQTGQMVRDDVV